MNITALLLLSCVGQAEIVPLPTVEHDRSRIGIFSGGSGGKLLSGQSGGDSHGRDPGRNQRIENQGYQSDYDSELPAGHRGGDSNAGAEGSRDYRNRLESDRPVQASTDSPGREPVGVIPHWHSGVVNRNSWNQEGSVIQSQTYGPVYPVAQFSKNFGGLCTTGL